MTMALEATMRDEIARLADKWESEAAGWESLPKHMKASIGDAQARIACAAELRALARTDHVEDKLGMVAEGWLVEQLPDGDYYFCDRAGSTDGTRASRHSAIGKLCAAMLAAAPSPDHSSGNCIAAMSRMKDAAMVAHKLCYEAMLKHPDVETLGDDGELHKAIHAIVGVDTPNYVASPGHSAGVGGGIPQVNVGTIGHASRDKSKLTAALMKVGQIEERRAALAQPADANREGADCVWPNCGKNRGLCGCSGYIVNPAKQTADADGAH